MYIGKVGIGYLIFRIGTTHVINADLVPHLRIFFSFWAGNGLLCKFNEHLVKNYE